MLKLTAEFLESESCILLEAKLRDGDGGRNLQRTSKRKLLLTLRSLSHAPPLLCKTLWEMAFVNDFV